MNLRTPRRRISPRTKRRYKAIREFFRRALGTSSQRDIKLSSSIAVNVTNFKHKIIGIENQIGQVGKHCRDLACLDSSFRKEAETFASADSEHDIDTGKEKSERSSDRISNARDTKLLYKYSGSHHRKSDESEYVSNTDHNNAHDRKNMTTPHNMEPGNYIHFTKSKRNASDATRDCDPSLRQHKAQSAFETFTTPHSTSSCHSARVRASPHAHLAPRHSAQRHEKRYAKQRECVKALEEPTSKRTLSKSPAKYYEEEHKSRKHRRRDTKLDQDFIADIIRRQYKPVKLFGRKESVLSQFSEPVCRDREFSVHEDVLEGPELCSCFREGRSSNNRSKYVRNHDLSDMRSICDTRLYSSKRHSRSRHRRKHVDAFDDASLYDLIPVKEKSSPKARRKFVEENVWPLEVPPSPRTLRPRFNLKAQYYRDYDDFMVHVKPNRKYLQHRSRRQPEYCESADSDSSEVVLTPSLNRREKNQLKKRIKVQPPAQIQQEIGTMSSLRYPTFNEQSNGTKNDTSLNKTQDSELSADKTDKALCEIKDILQSFLLEIKKEAYPSQFDQSDIANKCNEKQLNDTLQDSLKTTTGFVQNTHSSFNKYSAAQCNMPSGFMPPFQNPCCYPMLPAFPMNCMQNGYAMPSPSFTCHACMNYTKEPVCPECQKTKSEAVQETCILGTKSNETEELIKEIYKHVTQNPNSVRKKSQNKKDAERQELNTSAEKVLTSRSVGGSSGRVSRHDAQVGTPTKRYYSKSCEAIGSRMLSDTYCTNATQSDTILEKLSLEATQSLSDSDLSSEILVKRKRGKFHKILQSIGLFKKRKKDGVIEELSETESSVEVDVKPKGPYRQHVMNYAMHGLEYYQQPPVPPQPYQHRAEAAHEYTPPRYDPRGHYYPHHTQQAVHELYPAHRVQQETIHEHAAAAHHRQRPRPSAPPMTAPHQHYDPYHGHQHHQPQVPLCLKEIEVKSTGTQSDRKMSFFWKIAKKPPPRVRGALQGGQLQNSRSHTEKEAAAAATTNKIPNLLGNAWKNLQAKAEKDISNDPMAYSFKTQKQLANGDIKMRNAVLKKMFYKKNPFSPRNLVVRTLLGKDRSSFGEPQMNYKARMFF